MTSLYSLRTEGTKAAFQDHRTTKFVDGEVESSYLCTETECECPAGHRPSCRHRQMLPQMLAHGIANTHWFMDWDRSGSIVDFNGASKRLYDELAAAAEIGNIEPKPLPLAVRLRDEEGPALPQMIAQRRAQWRRL